MIETILSDDDLIRCVRYVRLKESMSVGLKDAHGLVVNQMESFEISLIGAKGELGFCRLAGLPWDGENRLNTFKAADVGALIQVRTTRRTNPRLVVRNRDNERHSYCLMSVHGPIVRYWGWILGLEAKRPEWVDAPYGRPPAWFVPKEALREGFPE